MKKGRILSLKEAVKYREELKRQKRKVVFTNGCFDIIHYGHIQYLFAAAKLGDELFIGLNSDSSVRKLKGDKRPVFPASERAEILSSFECVDVVVVFEEETPFNLISALLPDFLVKGGDYNISEIVGRDVVEKSGGKVVVLPYVKGHSTTEILKRTGNL
jgi:D-beta-D-heptose 7-phosphate kinase/D-beta-D-heptose 1-phosphate adenosyltransferase